MELIPILIVGSSVILFSVLSARRRRLVMEAQKQAIHDASEQNAESDVPASEPKAKPPVPSNISAKAHPNPEPIQSDSPKQDQTTEQNQPISAGQPGFVPWNTSSALQGIVYAEILGKPKALRQKRY